MGFIKILIYLKIKIKGLKIMKYILVILFYCFWVFLIVKMTLHSLEAELEHQDKRDNAYKEYIENNKQGGDF